MMNGIGINTLPQPDPSRISRLTASEILAAFVAAHGVHGCERAAAEGALSSFFDVAAAAEEARAKGLIVADGSLLRPSGAATGVRKAKSAAALTGKIFESVAFAALGAPHALQEAGRKKPDLVAATLKCVYGLQNLSSLPSRLDVRCAILRLALATAGEPFKTAAQKVAKTFKLDPLSRALYLAIAGMHGGTVVQADNALAAKALGAEGGRMADIATAIVRLALRPVPATPASVADQQDDLQDFALAVRRVARKLETKPYAGRVAIAQVYDAAVAQGLELGSLDDFKARLAEAAREGLLDLERYDITGPLDAALKERSRLRLGRDERHFIVNQWT